MRPLLIKLIGILGWVYSTIAVLILLAWFSGRILTDSYHWSQWLWWIPTPAMICVVLLGLISTLRPVNTTTIRNNRIYKWLAVTISITAYFMIFEQSFIRPDFQSSDGLRISHWNLTHPSPRQFEAYADALNEIQADIVVLTSASGVPWLERVSEKHALDQRPYACGVFTLLSRFPVIGSRELYRRENQWCWLVEVDTTKELGRTIILYLVDLPSEISMSRMLIANELLNALDRAEVPPPDIVIGDFNIPRGSSSIRAIFPDFKHAFDEAGHGYAATFPRDFPLYHIDHMLIGDSMRVLDYDIINPGMGRHNAQAATVITR